MELRAASPADAGRVSSMHKSLPQCAGIYRISQGSFRGGLVVRGRAVAVDVREHAMSESHARSGNQAPDPARHQPPAEGAHLEHTGIAACRR